MNKKPLFLLLSIVVLSIFASFAFMQDNPSRRTKELEHKSTLSKIESIIGQKLSITDLPASVDIDADERAEEFMNIERSLKQLEKILDNRLENDDAIDQYEDIFAEIAVSRGTIDALRVRCGIGSIDGEDFQFSGNPRKLNNFTRISPRYSLESRENIVEEIHEEILYIKDRLKILEVRCELLELRCLVRQESLKTPEAKKLCFSLPFFR